MSSPVATTTRTSSGIEDLGSVELNHFAMPDVTLGAKLRTLSFTLSWLNEAEYEGSFCEAHNRRLTPWIAKSS